MTNTNSNVEIQGGYTNSCDVMSVSECFHFSTNFIVHMTACFGWTPLPTVAPKFTGLSSCMSNTVEILQQVIRIQKLMGLPPPTLKS